jgi:threonine aldolase
MASDSPSNQMFPVMPKTLIERLRERYEFELWQPLDDQSSVIRLVASWATTEQAVDAFVGDLSRWAQADDANAGHADP